MDKSQVLTKLLFSSEEAADALSLSPWTIRGYAKSGLISSVKLGTRRLIHSAEIERIAKEGIQTSPPAVTLPTSA